MLDSAKKRLEKKERELATTNPKLHALIQRFITLAADGQTKANEISKNVTDKSISSLLRLRRLQARREANKLNKNGAGGGFLLHRFNSSGSESVGGGGNTNTNNGSPVHHKISGGGSLLLTTDSPTSSSTNTKNHTIDLLQIEGGEDVTSLHDRKPIRAEQLLKQAHKEFSVWRSRYVVLYPEGICYWDDETAFHSKKSPRGKLLFCDFITLSGRAADSAPRFMFMMLGKANVFVIHREDSTWVWNCPTKDSLHGWIAAINTAYKEFVSVQTRKAALMDAVWVVGSTEVWSVAEKLAQTNTSVDVVLGELNVMLHNQYEEEVIALRENYLFRQCFHIWMAWARAMRLKRVEAAFFSTATLTTTTTHGT
jgi:hypothetical protein